MEDDLPEDWLQSSSTAVLPHQLSRLEAHLRCPICSKFFETAMMADCGHAFCSLCVREWLGRGEDHQNCPQCKANRAPTTVLYKDRLKPCPSLNNAALEFKAARAALMQAVLHNGPSSKLTAGGGGGATTSSSNNNNKNNASRRTLTAQQQQQLDKYWQAREWSQILKRHNNYHVLKDKTLRAELGAMGMVSVGRKDELVFRHQTFIKLAEAEQDKVKHGLCTRTLAQVAQEVEQKARVQLNSGGNRKQTDYVAAEKHEGFDAMIREMKRRKRAQKDKEKLKSKGGGGGGGGGGTIGDEDAAVAGGKDEEHEAFADMAAAEEESALAEDCGGWQKDSVSALSTSMALEEDEEEEDEVVIIQTNGGGAHNNNNTTTKRRIGGCGYDGDNDGQKKWARTATSSASILSSVTQHASLSFWNCASCTLQNAEYLRQCKACGVPRRASMGKGGQKAMEDAQKRLYEELQKQKQAAAASSNVIVLLEGEAGESSNDLTVRLRRVDDGGSRNATPHYELLGKCPPGEECDEDNEDESDEEETAFKEVGGEKVRHSCKENDASLLVLPGEGSPSY